MATFQPNIPERQEPSYLSYSKGITQPEGDKSGAYAGQSVAAGYAAEAAEVSAEGAAAESAGKLFGLATTAVDNTLKDYMYNSMYEDVNTLRDGKKAPDQTLMQTGDDGKLPGDLEGLSYDAQTLQSARDSGKLTHTAYIGQLDKIASDMRARFPGYIQYIDKTMESITGINSANKYVEGLLRDINANITTAQSSRNKEISWTKELINQGILPASAMVKVETNQWTMSDIAREAEPTLKLRRDIKNAEDADKLRKLSQEAQSDKAVRTTAAFVNEKANFFFSQFRIANNVKTGAEVAARVTESQTGTGPAMGATEASQSYHHMNAIIDHAETAIWRQMNEVIPGTKGETQVSRIGDPEKARKIMQEYVGLVFGRTRDYLSANKLDMVGSVAQRVKANMEDFQGQLMGNQSTARFFAQQDFAEKHAPTWLKEYTTSKLRQNMTVNDHVFNDAKNAIWSQRDYRKVNTPLAAIERAQALDPEQVKFNAADYKEVVDVTKLLTRSDVSPVMKANVIYNSFNPENREFLDKFEQKDKISVFRAFTNPSVTKEVYKIGQSEPALWANYVNWTLNTFGNRLFTRDIADFNSFQDDKNITFIWNSANHKFDAVVTGNQAYRFGSMKDREEKNLISPERVKFIRENVDRLNEGINSISEIAKVDPRINVEAFLIERLAKADMNVGSSNIKGIPSRLIDALKSPVDKKAPQQPSEGRTGNEKGRALPYQGSENNAPVTSLEGWLKDPSMGKNGRPILNLTDPRSGEVVSEDIQTIPAGVDINEFIKSLRAKK